MMIGAKEYLGDGVYVQFDGGSIILATENGFETTNEIYLDGHVMKCFDLWRKRLDEDIAKFYRRKRLTPTAIL